MSAIAVEKMKKGRCRRSFPGRPLAGLLVLAFLAGSCGGGGEDRARSRAARLRRGVNLSAGMASAAAGRYPGRDRVTPAEVEELRAAGFDHVRLPIAPEFLWDGRLPVVLDPEKVSELKQAIGRAVALDLAVIVDIHPRMSFRRELRDDPAARRAFLEFWAELARTFSATPPESVFFELLNEPGGGMGPWWREFVEVLARRVRGEAPGHTLIISVDGLDQLAAFPPLPLSDLIYDFHYYNPMIFTHQGADWGPACWRELTGVVYPPDAAALGGLYSRTGRWFPRHKLKEYLHAVPAWGARRLDAEIARAAGWAREHGPVICGEFGVYSLHADPASRVRWIRDARTALERAGIGWCYFDYCGGFDLVKPGRGGRELDPEVLSALGLEGR